ncbi:hypothetical protein GobsT_20440 [Gemmata obscuriglobus]|uniref:Uncharacterized protein n=2 Tax=Gemmata obscuriglobus TaxID=114 RepID=A0A2Z3HEA1_9BACT|nr:hypothetical protein C1280_23170 [Gemmata obscuriglobus]QEG27290.1 hypothetical protein GobsT_20440 [Gemmata obscuriglobus]VTS04095.1 unnamed protein product [Gemmata obscuriglobus UQM 2246]
MPQFEPRGGRKRPFDRENAYAGFSSELLVMTIHKFGTFCVMLNNVFLPTVKAICVTCFLIGSI